MLRRRHFSSCLSRPFVALVAFGVGTLVSVGPSDAQAAGVSGGAYGHYTNVGLFGGPPGANGPAPQVMLPPGGAEPALRATEPSASAVYGPAKIFGGRWPRNLAMAPPSGPISVSTRGKAGPGGFITSTADIVLNPIPLRAQCGGEPTGTANCSVPGGFGPSPPTEGDELHSTCTADEKGARGSTRFVKAILATATDADGEPKDEEPIPDEPPANYTRTGQLTNVGDNYKIVYNEQIKENDGSITVNAVHLYLLGPIAIGEQILGQVRCSTGGATSAPPSPSSSAPARSETGPSDAQPPPTNDETGTSMLPVALVSAGALVAGAAGVTLWSRRRRSSGEQWLNGP